MGSETDHARREDQNTRSLQSEITHLSIERVRHGERGCYPAVSIDDVRGQALDDAGDRVTDVLGGRDQQRARE